MNPADISVVLVEPKGDRNIGAVCRAMMNFGYHDLRLVGPRVDHCSKAARHMAVKAESVLENARVFPDLATALADCRFAIGTTRRFSKYRQEFLHPDEAGRLLAGFRDAVPVAFVFGRESNGLRTDELDLCQRFMTIPASAAHPSLNLAQAVAICLYETAKGMAALAEKPAGRQNPAPAGMLENMFQHMRSALLAIGYLDPQNPDHIMRTYRRLFGRAVVTEREVRILQGLWSRLDWLAATGGEKGDPPSDDRASASGK